MFRRREGDDSSWISVSDLMAGLMMIFLFIMIAYSRTANERADKIQAIVVTWKEAEQALLKELKDEFEGDLGRWKAEIIDEELTIRFKSPEVMFDRGKSVILPQFKIIISEFFPRYVRVLQKFEPIIDEVRIEGHTSSEYGKRDPYDAYVANMELSQGRTRAVFQYAFQLPDFSSQEKNWMQKVVTANGLSSSRKIARQDGAEDQVRSRRVDFRVSTKTKEQILKILSAIGI